MPPWPRSPYKLPPVAPRFFWGSCNLVLFVMQFANLNKSADVGFVCLPTKCIYDLDMIQLCTVIRYPSGQDGGISPARDYPLYLARKPYNKFFIDQAFSVKMVGYWLRSFFTSLWTWSSSWSANMQKKTIDQYPAILTSHLDNNPYFQNSHHF